MATKNTITKYRHYVRFSKKARIRKKYKHKLAEVVKQYFLFASHEMSNAGCGVVSEPTYWWLESPHNVLPPMCQRTLLEIQRAMYDGALQQQHRAKEWGEASE
ncbi:MAG: hypothetical protein K2M42_05840 [Oscillospiraceae bacterium]|nr:hypothetical protein [Oscillospiraceae bacterium]